MRRRTLGRLAAIGAALLLLMAATAAAIRPGAPHDRYVIYYGWLTDGADGTPNDEAQRIARARPNLLIAAFYTESPRYRNLSRPVLDLLRAQGVQVFAYVTTSYAKRDLAAVMAEAAEYLAHGVDGIFFDEATDFTDDSKTAYYAALYAMVKALDRQVILNPGEAAVGEAVMTVTDMLMVEHQWRQFYQHNPWREQYPPERFMGTSSNEPGARAYLHYAVDLPIAIRDTREAWANGIGWHYSTDAYTELPAWFGDYVRGLR